MKTYTPKGLHGADLRDLLSDLGWTPAMAAKYLQVTERSVWRWLSEGSAPFAVVALLWHLAPDGRAAVACDLGNELTIYRGLAAGRGEMLAAEVKRLAYLVRLGDFGAANDPLVSGPASEKPGLLRLSHLELDAGLGLDLEPPPGGAGGLHGEGLTDTARR